MKYLRQATASQTRLVGPFVDDTDGTTAETGLTIANTDVRLSVDGGNMASKNSGGGTHDELGYYALTFDATDTATVGELRVVIKMAGALVVDETYRVLEPVVFDQLFADAAGFQVDLVDAPNATAVTAIQSGLATAAALTTVDGIVDSILEDTGTTIPAQITGLSIPTAAAVADAVWDESQAAHTTAGTFGELAIESAQIVTAVGTTIPNQNSAIATDVDAVQTTVDIIDGRIDTEIAAIVAKLPVSTGDLATSAALTASQASIEAACATVTTVQMRAAVGGTWTDELGSTAVVTITDAP